MNEKIKKLEDVKSEVIEIKYEDEVKLKSVIRRVKMYMNSINKDSEIINEINESLFYGNVILDFYSNDNSESVREWAIGAKKVVDMINDFIEEYNLNKGIAITKKVNPINKISTNDIFIIHGHDEGMKENVSNTIKALGLNPVILHKEANLGRTIIEKFEDFAKDSGYAIALLSPDDKYIDNGETKIRARQNVVFELGYFIGLLGRKRTFALIKGDGNRELMSDYQGVIYQEYDQYDGWKLKLVKELKALGYDLNIDSII